MLNKYMIRRNCAAPTSRYLLAEHRDVMVRGNDVMSRGDDVGQGRRGRRRRGGGEHLHERRRAQPRSPEWLPRPAPCTALHDAPGRSVAWGVSLLPCGDYRRLRMAAGRHTHGHIVISLGTHVNSVPIIWMPCIASSFTLCNGFTLPCLLKEKNEILGTNMKDMR